MPDPFDCARRVAAGIPAAADLAWLRDGFASWQRAAGDLSLERCLGLSRPRRGRLAQRDELLRELLAVLPCRDGEGAGRAILRALTTFERECWPTWQRLPLAPAGAVHVERVLFDLFALRVTLPRTGRGIRRALGREESRKRSEENSSDVRTQAKRAA